MSLELKIRLKRGIHEKLNKLQTNTIQARELNSPSISSLHEDEPDIDGDAGPHNELRIDSQEPTTKTLVCRTPACPAALAPIQAVILERLARSLEREGGSLQVSFLTSQGDR